MTLMPVGNMRLDGSRASNSGAIAVDVPALHVGELGGVVVEHVAPHVPHVAERAWAHRHLQAVAEVAHRGAPGEAVGGLHAHCSHAAVAELLGDLGQHDDGLSVDLHGELEGGVELGKRTAWELDVDHRTGDADDAAVLELGSRCGILGHGHEVCSLSVSVVLVVQGACWFIRG